MTRVLRQLAVWGTAVVLTCLSPAAVAASAVPSAEEGPSSYSEPAFADACEWIHYGEAETPPWWLFLNDPVCVEYEKRDITLSNGGALRFLAAEPARIAIAIPSCRYYQRDHWSVQATPRSVPLVAWDGQYWFDKGLGLGAVRLTNFKVGGLSAGLGDAVQALRPYFPELSAALAAFGDEAGESGVMQPLASSLLCSARR
ncbi:hypothetical protein ACF08N_37360 [Streptomyces sp. NPDC015127]|uniref:hypothetical protein n=1 Tax=Streptomyces sp. NPDC015127 TaxID=3364939 RepID=UPI0036FCC0DA